MITTATDAVFATPSARDRLRELFATGLKNAHAVEKQAIQLIERQLGDTEYSEVDARLRAHLDETHRQEARLDEIMDRHSVDRSALKDMVMQTMGNLAALAHMPASDAILKNTFANQAFENFEIASYRSLIALGEAAGFAEDCRLLEASLEEERSMAAWIDEHVADITRHFARVAATVSST